METAKDASPAKDRELKAIAGELLLRTVGPAADQVGAALADQLAYWRAMNLDRLAGKVRVRMTERGLSEAAIQALPFGAGFKLLQAASEEESEDVQELWASLLVSALDANSEVKAEKAYIDVLKQLSGAEAILLDLLWHSHLVAKARRENEDFKGPSEVLEQIKNGKWRKLPLTGQRLAIHSLIRMNCIVFERPNVTPVDTIQLRMDGGKEAFDRVQKAMHQIRTGVDISIGILEPITFDYAQEKGERYRDPEHGIRLTPMGFFLLKACNGGEARGS